MKRMIALLLIVSTTAFAADPTSYEVKAGTLMTSDDTFVEVEGGLYLNEEARAQVSFVLNVLEEQNKKLITDLTEANKRITEASAYVPGLPAWVNVVISAGLTILTGIATYFVVREATSGK